jgi:hypothetical protein
MAYIGREVHIYNITRYRKALSISMEMEQGMRYRVKSYRIASSAQRF